MENSSHLFHIALEAFSLFLAESIDIMKFLFTLIISFVFIACNNEPEKNDDNPVATIAPPLKLSYRLLKVYPHDTAAFTQGLQFVKGFLYEGTGNPERKPGYSK